MHTQEYGTPCNDMHDTTTILSKVVMCLLCPYAPLQLMSRVESSLLSMMGNASGQRSKLQLYQLIELCTQVL